MTPHHLPVADERGGAVQLHHLAGKEPQMLGRLVAAGGFIKPTARHLDQRIAAQHQRARMRRADRQRFRFGKCQRHLRRACSGQLSLQRAFIQCGGHRLI